MPNLAQHLAQHLSPFDGLSRHCEEWSKTLETSQKRWKIAVLGMKKGLTVLPVNPVRGEYEIRTREAVTPTRFPSVRHRPLGEFSNYATLSGVYPLSAT